MKPAPNLNHNVFGDPGHAIVNHPHESDPNVKVLCINDVCHRGKSSELQVLVGQDSYQALQKGALEASDLIAKVLSPQWVSMDSNMTAIMVEHQPINTAKVVSAPGVGGKCKQH